MLDKQEAAKELTNKQTEMKAELEVFRRSMTLDAAKFHQDMAEEKFKTEEVKVKGAGLMEAARKEQDLRELEKNLQLTNTCYTDNIHAVKVLESAERSYGKSNFKSVKISQFSGGSENAGTNLVAAGMASFKAINESMQ